MIGFLILLAGMCIYNDILIGPTMIGRLVARYGLQLGFCRWYYIVPSDPQQPRNNRIRSADDDGLIANEVVHN